MKGKYYVNCSVLEAKMGNNPSYAWRSILGSCDLLKEGLCWRIRNGKNAKIWGDKWVPLPTTFAIQSPHWVLDHEAKVAELMDRVLHGWNRGLLKNLFFLDEVKAILSIPISPNWEDALIWKGMKNGLFTVRSTYHMAKMRELQRQAESSNRAKKNEMWGALWRLPIPNAEKNFFVESMP